MDDHAYRLAGALVESYAARMYLGDLVKELREQNDALLNEVQRLNRLLTGPVRNSLSPATPPQCPVVLGY